MADRYCFAKSPAQRNAAPSEFSESVRSDVLLSHCGFFCPGWQFSYVASVIQLTQFNASIGQSQKRPARAYGSPLPLRETGEVRVRPAQCIGTAQTPHLSPLPFDAG